MRIVVLLMLTSVVWFVIGFVLADAYYKLRYQKPWEPRLATISGRTGKITSEWPFDIWVTINVPANETEKALFRLEHAKEKDRNWVEETAQNMRAWPSAWRWNVEFQ